VPLYDPHDSCEPPQPLPKTYDVEVAYADSVAGEFLGYLKKKSLYDNSVVIVVGDRGEGLESIHENRHAFDLYATQAINRRDGGLRGESIRYLRRYRLQDWQSRKRPTAGKRTLCACRSRPVGWCGPAPRHPLTMLGTSAAAIRVQPNSTAPLRPRGVTFQNMAFSALVTVR
jgi:hypothetical protein